MTSIVLVLSYAWVLENRTDTSATEMSYGNLVGG